MTDSPVFLAERLKTESEKTLAFFEGLSDNAWHATIYSEGAEWTTRSVLAHFVTAERGFSKLLPSIVAGGPGASEDFDIDRYNAGQQEKTRELAPVELIEQFKSVRAEMVAWVGSLSEADLQKTGRHPFVGPTTVGEMIKMIDRHNQIHQRDMRKLAGNSV